VWNDRGRAGRCRKRINNDMHTNGECQLKTQVNEERDLQCQKRQKKSKTKQSINHSISHSRNTAKAADVRLVVQIFFNS
jgi:hypothetical protein